MNSKVIESKFVTGPIGSVRERKEAKRGKGANTTGVAKEVRGGLHRSVGPRALGTDPHSHPHPHPRAGRGASAGTLSMLAQRRSKDFTRLRAIRNAGKHFLCPPQVRSFPIGSLRHKREHLPRSWAAFKTWPRAAVRIKREIHIVIILFFSVLS